METKNWQTGMPRSGRRISSRAQETGCIGEVHHRVPRRPAVVAVQVMLTLTVLLGFTALTVDMGYVWNVRADLQRTADAAAMAAAGRLSEVATPALKARQAAQEYVDRNVVMGEIVSTAGTSITLGRARLVGGQYVFSEVGDEEFPNAVRVRLTASRGLFFARVLGRHEKSVTAEATALLVPRDIAIVADLSASHNDDSELGSYRDTTINIWDVWGSLPGGSDTVVSTWTPESLAGLTLDSNGFNVQTAGPAWGYFRRLKWGETVIDPTYEPFDDAGLVRLPRWGSGVNDWNSPDLLDYLDTMRFSDVNGDAIVPYSAAEIAKILDTSQHGSSSRYRRQVAVALGFARWDSGKPGGAWESIPDAVQGNGDDRVDSSELTWIEPYFDEPGSRWLDYIYWASSRWSRMARTNDHFQSSFGPKTFTNYLLERRWSHSQTPELAATPAQPMQAVKDAVEVMVNFVGAFENDDQIALDIYGYTALHRVPLVKDSDLSEVTTGVSGLSQMQAGHIDGWTNMGGGLEKGIETLTTDPARPAAHKMIVLLTDGQANINENGQWPSGSYTDRERIMGQARQYVLDQAQLAADAGIRIFAVSVGAYADTGLMEEVATIAGGEHLAATGGDIATYRAQLEDIFVRLSGKRPVELIE